MCKTKATPAAHPAPDGTANLLRRYGCGPVTFTGADDALYERRLVLVRPDGHVAWRSDRPPADALALIDRVRGA